MNGFRFHLAVDCTECGGQIVDDGVAMTLITHERTGLPVVDLDTRRTATSQRTVSLMADTIDDYTEHGLAEFFDGFVAPLVLASRAAMDAEPFAYADEADAALAVWDRERAS